MLDVGLVYFVASVDLVMVGYFELSVYFGISLASCFGVSLASCFGVSLASCFGTSLASCFGASLASCFGASLVSCFGISLFSCFGASLISYFGASLFSCFGTMLSPSDCCTKFEESFCEKKALGLAILFGFASTLTADLAIICGGFISYFYSFYVRACSFALAMMFSPFTRRFSMAGPLFWP
jgi:hypothetical protein